MTEREKLAGRRILVVEDEYRVAGDVEDTIRALGGDVVEPCAGTAQARRQIAETRPDGAILDLNLKGFPVAPLAWELDRAAVPILYHTGYDTTPALEQLPEGRLLVKPLTPDRLREELLRSFAGPGRDA